MFSRVLEFLNSKWNKFKNKDENFYSTPYEADDELDSWEPEPVKKRSTKKIKTVKKIKKTKATSTKPVKRGRPKKTLN